MGFCMYRNNLDILKPTHTHTVPVHPMKWCSFSGTAARLVADTHTHLSETATGGSEEDVQNVAEEASS